MHRWASSSWKLPVLSGLALGVGYYLPVLVPLLVGFVPVLYWLDRHIDGSRYERFRSAFIFGLVAAIIGLHLCYAMFDFSWLAGVLWLWFASLLAIRISLVLLLASWLRRRTGWSWGLLLPLAWVPFDWLQTFGDLRMTGDHAAHAMAAYPFLIQFADVVGHYGVSTFVFVVNGLVYDALLHPRRLSRRRSAVALAVLLVVVLGYDTWCWNRSRPSAGTLRVALIQPNIPLLVKRGSGTEAEQRVKLLELSHRAAESNPDLIVWPESARPDPVYHWLDEPGTYVMPEVQRLAVELGSAFLVGVEYARIRTREDYDIFNAAILVDAQGRLDPTWAAKVYLVPFVEATPFRKIFGPLVEGRGGEWEWLAGSFTPGPRDQVMQLNGSRLGLLVCYEQLFPDLARRLKNAGAQFQVIITNDAWFGRTPFQHFQANAVRLRAIENRSEFVRVANTGISGFVDRYGRYHDKRGWFEIAVATRDVELSAGSTIYGRVGDVVVWVLIAGLVGAIVVARISARPAFPGSGASADRQVC
jgi:apolipoprotein N-acyltransferase